MKVCVIGSGISGLSSAWSLAEEGHEVTLFEQNKERHGGHAYTYYEGKTSPPVDLGFQVFNLTTYPYLVEFFRLLGVDHEPSDMSFSFSVDNGKVEWASNKLLLKGLFAQPGNAVSPSFLNMLRETFRFGNQATEVLNGSEKWKKITLGQYLDLRGYSNTFREQYLLPMTAAVWSVPNETMLDFPVIPLVRFWDNHHLLHPLGARPCWRVVKARSEKYVDAVIKNLEARSNATVKLGTKIVSVVRSDHSVVVTDSESKEYTFDHAVLACHSNQSLELLKNDSNEEDKRLLSKVRYQPNDVYLHSDVSQMPVSKNAWASWNVLDQTQKNSGERSVCVTYWLNNLQNLPSDAPLRLCTLNPIVPPAKEKIIAKMILEHPVFDVPALEAQTAINTRQANYESLENINVWFAGAWLGSGFHEDGIRSAVAVTTAIGKGKVPMWALRVGAPEKPALQLIRGPSPEITMGQSFGLRLFETVAGRGIKKGFLRLVLPNGEELAFGRASKDEAVNLAEPTAILTVNNLDMMMRCIRDSDVGLGEAYIENMYDVDDIVAIFNILIINQKSLEDTLGNSYFSGIFVAIGGLLYKAGNIALSLQHMMRKNTVAGSRRNIEEHYDLGNEMYELFLDETMTYSSGIHRKEFGAPIDEGKELGLKESQLMKFDEIIRRAGIKKGDHVLEIGCGWGSFAIRVAQTKGCKVTGITISTEQLKEAKARVKKLGLETLVNLIICDYRKLGTEGSEYEPGSFDRVVSIEMIEAVGHEHLPEYFEVINRMLRPGGKACIQAISIRNERYMHYMNTSDFIRRHIFPGGHLPCMDAVHWATEDTDLALLENFDIGPDYAITLRMWRENFTKQHDRIMALGYPESFFRKWIFYFAYCEAGFEQKYILDYHIVLCKDAEKHNKQVKLHRADESRLRFGDTKSSVSSVDDSKSIVSDRVPMLPIISTALPVLLWLFSIFLTSSRELRLVSSIAVTAVFITSLLGAMFFRSYLSPPMSVVTSMKRKQWRGWWVDSLFATLVVITVIMASILEFAATKKQENQIQNDNSEQLKDMFAMDYFLVVNMLLFSSFGRLTSSTALSFTFSNVMPDFIHSVALSVVMVFSLDAQNFLLSSIALNFALLYGIGEVHSIIRGWQKMMSLRGCTLGNSSVYKAVCAADATALVLTRILPLSLYCWYSWNHIKDAFSHQSEMNTDMTTFTPPVLALAFIVLLTFNVTLVARVIYEMYLEWENGWNTDTLLNHKRYARSRDELIRTMSSTSRRSGDVTNPAKANGSMSGLYYGTVMHKRTKVKGVSPSSNAFTYNIWMAYVDLDEVKSGTAFSNVPWVSVGSKWNVASWNREDYFGFETGEDLDVCVRMLVKKRLGMDLKGPIRLLTNLRCFGYGFNPVSIFYCFDQHNQLQACVLEVSNTPWLVKRQYVIPVNENFSKCRWQKDFHVSPFMDVFHDYEWTFHAPSRKIKVAATSYRRPIPDGVQEGEEWEHRTGDAETILSKGHEGDAKTFFVNLSLERQSSTFTCILWQPFMTFSVVLWIHIQAFVVMILKGCEFKQTPRNQRQAGLNDLVKHLCVFIVASMWSMILFIMSPFQRISTYVKR
mmetsp:Transcript_4016/g.5348  ORF Transcript_4016/g.5348 Transcript_4016/m.5348 type:complete len:1587 (+) Transcript_4016:149-4909(+)